MQQWQNLDIEKPQKFFDNVPANNESGPFMPLLTSKPHATVPLEESLKLANNEDGKEQYDKSAIYSGLLKKEANR